MGLDMNFYKKGFVELDYSFVTRDRDLFDFITEECGIKYGDEEYGKYVEIPPDKLDKVISYIAKRNREFGNCSYLLAELVTCKEQGETVYINADW